MIDKCELIETRKIVQRLHNNWKNFKYPHYDYGKTWSKLKSQLGERGVNIDDLI